MSRRQPYPEYKDSGVEWLGEIPTHWEMRRLKYAAPESSEKFEAKPEESLYLGLENIESGTGRLLLDDLAENVASTVVAFREDDVLFGKLRPYLAKVVHANFDGVGTTELLVLRPKDDVESRFLFYYLLSDGFIDTVNSSTYGAKMPRANSEQVGDLTVNLPPLAEQRAIAAFLDRQTARLDDLIAEQRRLIELLQERRAARISHAVTQGLDPDVPMKDSGISWLGEIPAHWETRRLKCAAAINTDTLPENTESDFGLQYVDIGNVDSTGNILDVQEMPFERAPSRARRQVRHGDTIISTVRTYLKAIAYIEHPSDNLIVSTGFAVLRPRPELEPRYLWRLVQSQGFVDAVVAHSEGIGYPAIAPTKLAELPVWIPPIPEQRAIAAYLDRETAKTDAAVAEIETSIAHLEEYRTALISAAVTGKIDVRQDQTFEVSKISKV